jgi:hypothetical protein
MIDQFKTRKTRIWSHATFTLEIEEYTSFKQFNFVKMTRIESTILLFIYTLLECQECDGQNFLAAIVQ